MDTCKAFLSDSSKNLGSLKLVKDVQTKQHLSKAFLCSHLNCNNNRTSATAPMTSRKRTRGVSAPSSPLRPQSARFSSNRNKRRKISKCNSARKIYKKRPISVINNDRISNIPFEHKCTFDFDENVDADALQLKNQIMSQIIQHKIFAQDKLIAFFKVKLMEYGCDSYVVKVLRELCEEFHLPFQKVMANTKQNETC